MDVETEALRGEVTSLWPHGLEQEGRGSTCSWGPSLVIPQLLSKLDCHPAHFGTWYTQQAPPSTHKLVEKAAWEGTGLVSVGSAKIRAHQSRQPLFEKTGMGRRLRPCTRDPDMGPKAGSPRTVLW